jgi:hypothetical protein
MKYEWLVNWIMCFVAPIFIFEIGGFNFALIYVLGVIAACLTRIGDIIRNKLYEI